MLPQPSTTSNCDNALTSRSRLPLNQLPIHRGIVWSAMIGLYWLAVTGKRMDIGLHKIFAKRIGWSFCMRFPLQAAHCSPVAVLSLRSDRHVRNNTCEKRNLPMLCRWGVRQAATNIEVRSFPDASIAKRYERQTSHMADLASSILLNLRDPTTALTPRLERGTG